MRKALILCAGVLTLLAGAALAQDENYETPRQHTLYDIPPRNLIDMPTAGTLPRGHYNVGLYLYNSGGAIGYTDIGLSSRFMLGISFGGDGIISNREPGWNPRMAFNLRFRLVDELEMFPAIAVGYADQGFGGYLDEYDRYRFKSRGFFVVGSRSFYFMRWTAAGHFGLNYSREFDGDDDSDANYFFGFDATFNYNLALLFEYDGALNDNKSSTPDATGRGRGYMNMSVKWLFAENLELEFLLKDLLNNRRDADTVERGIRIMYIDNF